MCTWTDLLGQDGQCTAVKGVKRERKRESNEPKRERRKKIRADVFIALADPARAL